jgi:hypothetical protein
MNNRFIYALFSSFFLVSFVHCLIFFENGHQLLYASELFSGDEKPFNIPYDSWISQFWNWYVNLNPEESTPTPDGCLINESGSMVMLMGTTVQGSPHQVCEIPSESGIMIPLWAAWCDTGDHKGLSDEELTKCAREEYNLGKIGSQVKVDGIPISNLDVVMSLISGSLDYDVKALANVTEYSTKGFNITIPEDSQCANCLPGTWRAGSHGWWVFLKPLTPGEHTISYNVRVTPTGALTSPGTSPHFSDISYLLKVK